MDKYWLTEGGRRFVEDFLFEQENLSNLSWVDEVSEIWISFYMLHHQSQHKQVDAYSTPKIN
jgi:hypothetical protein